MDNRPEIPEELQRCNEPAAGDGRPARRRWLRWTAMGTGAAVLGVGVVGWLAYDKLDGNITADSDTAAKLRAYEAERPPASAKNVQNILLIGSDDRGGGNGEYGTDDGTQRSDTTILLHLAADRKSATAVSIPRDLMVQVPECTKPDGTRTAPLLTQFNYAFEAAGPACTIRTVERMTDIRIDHHMILDFTGFKHMVDAVDGVEVCLPQAVADQDSHLNLAAGRQVLRGEQALGYVRARKSLGNGSDTQRMARQQEFLAALVKKVQGNGVLLNPARLYPLLDAATSSLTTDEGLASLRGLFNLVRSVRDIPTKKIHFLTVPRQAYAYNVNRDELVQPDAGQLFARLRADRPIPVRPAPTEQTDTTQYDDPAKDPQTGQTDARGAGRSNGGDESDKPVHPESATPTPVTTFRGTSADRGICR
ncbi:LCP family protein [Streptomyces niger]|uniref:LCP family protein n=1 Tax=Streptomyces niger TaxID=66373 RepID=UPI000A98C455|nr:LCP family protein [Streptomyces niger]